MKSAVLALLWLLFPASLFPATRINLDREWFFRTDPTQAGVASGWHKQQPADTELVTIPHTWNIGKHESYQGKGWYFCTFEMPTQAPGVFVDLHFGATFYSSRVWLNGIEIGGHEGGYTAYSFDVTPYLRASNYLAVEVDNRIGRATIPGLALRGKDDGQGWYDWWNYGGMVRDVWLTLAGSVQVQRQRMRSKVHESAAVIDDEIFLENRSPRGQRVLVRATAFGPDNRVAAHEARALQLDPGKNAATLAVNLPSPMLWGIDHPNMYRMVVQVTDEAGNVLDEQSDTFGIRTIEIRNRHLLLNGERLRLTGLARHEDSVWEGLAETPGTMRYDYDDMKTLQVTLTRPVHYPQNPFIFDYADRHGILLIPEIPLWQFSEAQLRDPKVLALAKQQMQEMIEQAGNHPSIFAWSVCNESDTATPGGIAYFRAMRDFIRQLDPDRYVSYADDHLALLERAEDSAANDADFLMMNEYYGSWHGPASALPASLDKVGRMFPSKMAIISEFGLPGLFAKDAADGDLMRVKIIQDQMPELARRDWIAGAILWCYQDYRSHRNLRPGQVEGYVDHGVVDQYRQRRPSYYVWKEMNAPAALGARWAESSGSAPTNFTASVRANGAAQLPSYPMRDYRLQWEVRDENSKVIASGAQSMPDLAREQTLEEKLQPLPQTRALRLNLTLVSPTGQIAAEKSIEWRRGADQLESEKGVAAPVSR